MGIEATGNGAEFKLLTPRVNIEDTVCLVASIFFISVFQEVPATTLSINTFKGGVKEQLSSVKFQNYDYPNYIFHLEINLTKGEQRLEFVIEAGNNLDSKPLHVWIGSVEQHSTSCLKSTGKRKHAILHSKLPLC